MPEKQPTHGEIMARVDALAARVDGLAALAAQHDTESSAYRAEVRAYFQNITSTLRVMGEAVEKMEQKVFAYDLLRARVVGMIGAGVVLIGVMFTAFWWAFHSKIEAALGIK